MERGQLAGIRPRLWQTDTAVAKNSWGYTENNQIKDPADLVCDLVDIVSKNGCMLLNIGPKADGSITEEDQAVLRAIGNWLKVNGESIYDTGCWQLFGEGPTQIGEGAFTDTDRSPFTPADMRFTYRAPYLYVNVMAWPEDGAVSSQSLGSKKCGGVIKKAELLGFDIPLSWKQETDALTLQAEGKIQSRFPVCLKLTIE